MKVVFFESATGRCYVQDFLKTLSIEDRASILAVLSDIQANGYGAVGCSFRQVDGKLWEIKTRAPGGGYRLFYVVITGGNMVLLHAYKKKSQKAPPKEIKIARRRMKEVLI